MSYEGEERRSDVSIAMRKVIKIHEKKEMENFQELFKEFKDDINKHLESVNELIETINGINSLTKFLINVGKLCIALSAIAGTIWAAMHFGQRP